MNTILCVMDIYYIKYKILIYLNRVGIWIKHPSYETRKKVENIKPDGRQKVICVTS